MMAALGRAAGDAEAGAEVTAAANRLHGAGIGATKRGRTITYRLRLSVLEDALLGFAETFGLEPRSRTSRAPISQAASEET